MNDAPCLRDAVFDFEKDKRAREFDNVGFVFVNVNVKRGGDLLYLVQQLSKVILRGVNDIKVVHISAVILHAFNSLDVGINRRGVIDT